MKFLYFTFAFFLCFSICCKGQNAKDYKFIDNNKLVSEFVDMNTYKNIKSIPNYTIIKKYSRDLGRMVVVFKSDGCTFTFMIIDGEYILQEADITNNNARFLKEFKILNHKSYVMRILNIKSSLNNITFLANEGTESLTFFFKNNLLVRVGYLSQPIE